MCFSGRSNNFISAAFLAIIIAIFVDSSENPNSLQKWFCFFIIFLTFISGYLTHLSLQLKNQKSKYMVAFKVN